MKVDKKLIEDVAKNSRLNLTEKEIEEFSNELKDVLEAFSKLKEVNTENEEEAFHPIKISNVFRNDEICTCLSQEESLRNSKHKKDGYFLSPRTIEK